VIAIGDWVRGWLLAAALGALAVAAPACTRGDHDALSAKIDGIAATEGSEMLEAAVVGTGPAIRAAIEGGGAFTGLEVTTDEGETFTLSGAITLSPSGSVRIATGTLTIERGDEHPIEVELTDVLVDFGADDTTLAATFTGGVIVLVTEGHAEYGGGTGGHSHGGAEEESEEEEATFEVALELTLPTGAGAVGLLGHSGRVAPLAAEEEMAPVPAAAP